MNITAALLVTARQAGVCGFIARFLQTHSTGWRMHYCAAAAEAAAAAAAAAATSRGGGSGVHGCGSSNFRVCGS
jgi:hypothetical protein